MDDPERLDFQPPLPGNALEATMTFLVARGGLAPGYRTARRSEATHAELRTTGLSGKAEERRLTREDAEAWLAEVEELRRRHERLDAEQRGRRDELRAERDEVAATISLDCPRCGVPREHTGRQHLMIAGSPEELGRTGEHLALARPSAIVLELYACPRCGSVEFFRPLLPHPLRADPSR